VRTAARRAQSVNNLKQIGLALHNYQSANDALPAPTFDHEGRPLHGWLTRLLPYMEQVSLYNQINMALPWDDPRNAVPFGTVVGPYHNPGIPRTRDRDDAGYALSEYAENARMVGVRSLDDVRDGKSQTILAGEVPAGFRPWGDPVNWRDPARGINRAPDGFGGPFKGGANFLFADGSVRFLKNSVAPKVIEALGTPAGGERVGNDDY
jgi:prepilin-type processing-associated H-X9-DG protein